jgi:hypothetical protein
MSSVGIMGERDQGFDVRSNNGKRKKIKKLKEQILK